MATNDQVTWKNKIPVFVILLNTKEVGLNSVCRVTNRERKDKLKSK